ncbi:unnamed protein product [Paramecium octaurelia]|uniref:Uncharacterized protein n=1 Tax=Paramecium octaurelia TaxID=43137 RepID=A0A8S1VY50_PAROT|nr:unnamed protein product [Paramecium octaurelia]
MLIFLIVQTLTRNTQFLTQTIFTWILTLHTTVTVIQIVSVLTSRALLIFLANQAIQRTLNDALSINKLIVI